MEFLLILHLLACTDNCNCLQGFSWLYYLLVVFSQLYPTISCSTRLCYLLIVFTDAWKLYSTICDLNMCENVCLQVLSTCGDFKDLLPPASSPTRGAAVKHTKDSESAN